MNKQCSAPPPHDKQSTQLSRAQVSAGLLRLLKKSLPILNKILTRAQSNLFGSWVPFVVLTLVLATLVTFQGWRSYDEKTNTAQHQVENLTLVLSNELNRSLDGISRSLDFIVTQIKPEAMVTDSKSRYQNEMNKLLAQQVKLNPLAVVIRIFDTKGDLIYSAVPNEYRTNVSDREYFNYLRYHPGETYFSPTTIIGKHPGAPVLPIGKAILSSSGAFLGVVLITLPINSLKEAFQDLEVGSGGTILLRRIGNGSLIYRYPDNSEKTNHQLPNTLMEKMIADGIKAGTATYVSAVDGVKRLYSFRVLDTPFPYFISVGLAQSDYLASWRKSIFFMVLGAIALDVLVGLFFFRQRRAYKELKIGLEALALSQESLRLVNVAIANANDIVIITQAEPREQSGGPPIVFVNEAFVRETGYRADEVIGKTCAILQGPKSSREPLDRIRTAIDKWESIREELLNYKKNGEEFWVELEIIPIPNEVGWFTHWISIERNITNRKLAHEQLRSSEEKLRGLYDLSPLGIARSDMSGRFIEFNEAFRAITGYTNEELLSIGYWQITPRKYEASEIFHFKNIKETGRFGPYEKTYVNKNGVEVPVQINGILIKGDDGENYIWALIEDITGRKLGEKALFEASHRLELAVKAGSVGIWDWDIVNNVLIWDEQMYRLYGVSKDQFSGAYDAWIKGLHPEDREQVELESQNALTGLKEYDVKFRVIWPDGSIHFIHALGSVELDSSGEPFRMTGTNWDITDQKLVEKQAEEFAFTDPLTALPNRRLFADRLQRALKFSGRSKQYCALLSLDIDYFKTINDHHGHDIGDLVLKAAAQCFFKVVRTEDTVARMGGDEFMILLEDLGFDSFEAASAAKTVSEKILASYRPAAKLTSSIGEGSLSIGITSFLAGQLITVDELMKQSDLALYQAKQAGRNCIKFYDAEMQVLLNARVDMEVILRQAIEHEWFVLHYQPQVDQNQQITAVEALLRLNHPQRGLITPAQFLELAESSMLILTIGWWVVNAACRQLALWSSQENMAHLTLSVNISIKQFQTVNFVSKLMEIVDRSGIHPRQLTLELTESLFMADLADAMIKMKSLKEYGFHFSLDDFGTGYSSLSYLKSLEFDELKIDKTFIADIPSSQTSCDIVKIIVLMCETLGLKVIAEGVETKEQLEYLQSIGCHYYQGYLFFHPMPLDEFVLAIRSQSH